MRDYYTEYIEGKMPLPHNGLIKLSEECGELIQVAMKRVTCPEAIHWDGSNQKARLEEEIADVLAATAVVIANFELDQDRITSRIDSKKDLFEGWLKDEQCCSRFKD